MAKSFKSTRSLTGGEYKQKLYFVPCADNEPKVGHEISEPAIFRFLLNEETLEKFDEADEVEIAKMLEILKDIDKHSKITQVEAYRSSMMKATDTVKAYHVFIVFNSISETADDGVYCYWWSLEKNTDYIFLQRSRNKENVKDKFKGEERTRVKLIEKDLEGKGTIKDLFAILWANQMIAEKYHIKKSNCQSLVTFVGQQITNIGYKFKGKFKYSPPPEKGLDKKMLDLINVIRGYSDNWSPLFHLIRMGSTDLVDKTIASGKYDINASCNGLTPLHLAIKLKKTKMVQLLLQHPLNADPTKRDASGKSALLLACSVASGFEMKEEIIDLLLAHDKVKVDDVDEDGRTALHFAASRSNVNIFQKLLEKGANPNIFDKWGRSPLHVAAGERNGNEIIDLLLAHGKFNVDDVNGNGETALHLSARDVNIFRKLLEKGANPNIFDKKGRSPLHMAAMHRWEAEIFDLLLAHDKVNVDHVDEDGQTALHLAARKSNVGGVQKLLEKGANPNIFDKEGRSPLHLAAQKSYQDYKITDLLLAHDKVMIDHADENGQTALHLAASESNVDVFQKLLEKGANPNITDKWGQSPLHVAAKIKRNGNEIMDLLLAHSNVKVDDVDEHGRTALHIAAYKSNVIAVEYLINKGANPNFIDKWGNSPLHVAGMGSNQRDGIPVIDLLLEAKRNKGMGDVNDANKQGMTALHYAAAFSNKITAEHLIKKGANVNCRANVGLTPIHYAALGAKDMKIIDLLLQNINEGDIEQYRDDERLLLFARHNVHGLEVEVIDRLCKKGIIPPNTETDHCTGEFDDEITDVNTRRFVDKGVDPSIDLTEFNGLDFLIARVKISLGIYDNINGHNQSGKTLLSVAIRANNVDWVRNLLEKGADPTLRDNDGDTPLYVAAGSDTDLDILNLLLESGKVDINETILEYAGGTALHMAIKQSNTAAAEFLLSKGANPNITAIYGWTPLHYAALYAKDLDMVELLLNHPNVDVYCLDNLRRNALYYAKENKKGNGERIANLLKEKGAVEIENDDELFREKNESLETLLKYTSSNAEDEIEKVLSDATIEDQIARINEEHLISAIRYSDVESVRRLLINGADINSARGKHGENALHLTSYWAKTTDIIDVILETEKFDINGVDNEGRTPLHWAINKTYYSKVNAGHLIQLGADPTIANKEGDTPLHKAARYAEEIETIKLILENEQVDINSRGKNGWTALHHAIQIRRPETVRNLLEKGADPNAADENGATPLHLAAKQDYYNTNPELIDIILETGKCNINGVDNDGRTPLHYAIERYFPATINARRLIEMGADPGIADMFGITPLHMAAMYADSMDLIDELLLKVKTGAVDVNCVDNQGRTPLACVRDNHQHPGRRRRIIARLKEYGAKE